jgi:alpha-D-ribose 1-methylphosphonate 5-triphosphate diphosphatase
MWLSNLKIVLPDQTLEAASVRLEGGHIAEIRDRVVEGLNFGGLTLIPGIVDLHGDMLEREIEPRPSSEFPIPIAMMELDKRLAAAGVTTAFAAISFAEARATRAIRSEERARKIIQAVRDFRQEMRVDWRVHARFDITNLRAPPVLRDLIAAQDVALVSLNDHTPGQGQYRNLEYYLEYSVKWRGVSMDEARARLVERMQMQQECPPSWPVIRGVTELAQRHQIPLASHDDDTVDKVGLMANLGASISEFPVTLDAAREARGRGMWVAMGAPNALRGGSHSGNLSALDTIQEGLLNFLMSDYSAGAMLQAAYFLHRKQGLPLHKAIGLITASPAAAVRLHDRGEIVAGKIASLVIVEELEYPRVRLVLREGRTIYSDGTQILHPSPA